MRRIVAAVALAVGLSGCTINGGWVTGAMLERAIGGAANDYVHSPSYGYSNIVRGPDGGTSVVSGSCNGSSCYGVVTRAK